MWRSRVQAGPLIVRELREQSRRPATHWLRVLGAAGVVLITYQLMGNPAGGGVRFFPAGASGLMVARNPTWLETLEVGLRQFENRGSALFSLMNLALLAGIWLVGWTVVEVLLAPGSGGSVGQTLLRRAAAAGDLGAILVSHPTLVSSTTSRIYSRHLLQWPAVIAFLAVAAVLASTVLFLAKRWVERSRLEGRPAGRGVQTVEWLGRPRYFGALLERIRVRTLAREPVLWSEFRSWRLRVGIWLMPPALAPALVAWVGDAERYEAPALVFAALMAVAAASCLHAERASGVLELLLTAPRGVDHVWRGKVGALLLQALPSFALLLAIATAMIVGAAMASGGPAAAGRFLAGFVVSALSRLLLVVAAGAFFSLRCRAFLPALFSTALTAGAFEVLRRWVASGADSGNASRWSPIPLSEAMTWLAGQAVCSGLEILAASVFLVLLRRTLVHRRFVVRG